MKRGPETEFAWNGDVALAYQVFGSGPVDLVYLQGWTSHVDLNWESPALARFLRGLGRHARVIHTDRRGWGCSDRFSPGDVAPLEVQADDIVAVMDAAGSERAVVFGSWDTSLQLHVVRGLVSGPMRGARAVRSDGDIRRQRWNAMDVSETAGRGGSRDAVRTAWGTPAWNERGGLLTSWLAGPGARLVRAVDAVSQRRTRRPRRGDEGLLRGSTSGASCRPSACRRARGGLGRVWRGAAQLNARFGGGADHGLTPDRARRARRGSLVVPLVRSRSDHPCTRRSAGSWPGSAKSRRVVRPGARDRPLHRHRGLHRNCGGPRRREVARAHRAARPDRAKWGSWLASAERTCAARATACWRPSTARHGAFGAPRRSSKRWQPLGVEVRAGLPSGEIELAGDRPRWRRRPHPGARRRAGPSLGRCGSAPR